MLGGLESIMEEGCGESITGASLTSRSEPLLASLSATAASPPRGTVAGGGGGSSSVGESPASLPEVIVVDIRPGEAAEAFAAVRLAGALHVPFNTYMTQDKLPPVMHAARRAVPQPVIVLYDDCTGRAMDGPDFAGKLIQAGRFDAVMILEGGLRAAAVEEPRLIEGSRSEDYITGVRTEVRRSKGGHGVRHVRQAAATSPAGTSGASGGVGAGRSPQSPSRGGAFEGMERGSQVSAGSTRTVGTFGSSRRF